MRGGLVVDAMKSRPILFSTPMVRALLDGKKTQTRRIVKPNVAEALRFMGGGPGDKEATVDDVVIKWSEWIDDSEQSHPHEWCLWCAEYPEEGCVPIGRGHGNVGELLWVREQFIPDPNADHDAWDTHIMTYVEWAGCGHKIADVPPALKTPAHCFRRVDCKHIDDIRWRPSIHMPRYYSRLTLRLTDVRVQRVQDISTEDCIAEGLASHLREYDAECDLREQFRQLWASINGEESWDLNPWVWCLSFDVIKRNVDEVVS